jgi:WD40 repeat protein
MLTVVRTEPHKILVARGNVAEVWNHEGRLDAVLRGHEDAIAHVQFSPNTNLAITCCSLHGIAKLWEVGSQKCLLTLRHGDRGAYSQFLYVLGSTTTRVVTTNVTHHWFDDATFFRESELKQWCVQTGNCISTLNFRPSGDIAIAFTSQGVNVLHVQGSSVALLNMDTGASVWEHQVEFPFSYSSGCCLSRCGNWILTITRDRQTGHRTPDALEIWNATTCAQRHTMRAREGNSINNAWFSPDASRILFGNRRRGVFVWNIGHDHRVHKFKHESGGLSARFSPDGRELLTCIAENFTVWLWSIDDHSLGWCIHSPGAGVEGMFYTGRQRGGARGP